MRSICLVDAAGCSTSTLWNINVVKAVSCTANNLTQFWELVPTTT